MARARRRVRERSATHRLSVSTRLLLDTHVWLWWFTGDSRLSGSARDLIAGAPEVRFSAASAWEIAIKASLGKLTLARTFRLGAELQRDGFEALPIELAHAEAVRALPMHHRDPFDRLLIAQAQAESLTIVTADPQFERYDVEIVRAA